VSPPSNMLYLSDYLQGFCSSLLFRTLIMIWLGVNMEGLFFLDFISFWICRFISFAPCG
jgi:hypothetical protein